MGPKFFDTLQAKNIISLTHFLYHCSYSVAKSVDAFFFVVAKSALLGPRDLRSVYFSSDTHSDNTAVVLSSMFNCDFFLSVYLLFFYVINYVTRMHATLLLNFLISGCLCLFLESFNNI